MAYEFKFPAFVVLADKQRGEEGDVGPEGLELDVLALTDMTLKAADGLYDTVQGLKAEDEKLVKQGLAREGKDLRVALHEVVAAGTDTLRTALSSVQMLLLAETNTEAAEIKAFLGTVAEKIHNPSMKEASLILGQLLDQSMEQEPVATVADYLSKLKEARKQF